MTKCDVCPTWAWFAASSPENPRTYFWIYSDICQCHHHAICLTTGPQSLPKRVLPRKRSSAFSFSFQYSPFSLRSSNSGLRLLPLLPVTSVLPSIFPSIKYFRRQFLRKMWPIQLALLLFVVFRISLSILTLCNTSTFPTRSVQLIISIRPSTTFRNFPGISYLIFEIMEIYTTKFVPQRIDTFFRFVILCVTYHIKE